MNGKFNNETKKKTIHNNSIQFNCPIQYNNCEKYIYLYISKFGCYFLCGRYLDIQCFVFMIVVIHFPNT